MTKYSDKRIRTICDLIASDDYTIPELCKNSGISEATYHVWKNEKLEFLEAIKKAEKQRLELFKQEARKGLLKRISGFTFDEKKTIYISDSADKTKPKIKEQTVTTKYYPPDVTACIFVAKNTDPENFADKHDVNVTGDVKVKIFKIGDQEIEFE